MVLSILIPSVGGREENLLSLLKILEKQILNNKLEDKIEIIINRDNFKKSIGSKSAELVNAATGKYISGIGDDDIVSEDYCETLIETIKKTNADQITFNIKQRWNGKYLPYKTIVTHEHKSPEKVLYGLPILRNGLLFGLIRGVKSYTSTKICAKTSIYQQYQTFPNKHVLEDSYPYYKEMIENDAIKTTHYIDKTLYIRNFKDYKSLAGKNRIKNRAVLNYKPFNFETSIKIRFI